MSTEMLIRGFFAFIISLIITLNIYQREMTEKDPQSDQNVLRYAPYVPAYIYPLFTLVIFVLSCFELGLHSTIQALLSLCFDAFLHISLYYFLLLLIMPILRKKISSRVCSALWILPNYLYFIHMNFMELPEPKLILHISDEILPMIIMIWFIGASVYMIYKIISHFIYRYQILKDSHEVTDELVLSIYQKELKAAHIRKAYRLVCSSHVKTPLSIGFFKRTIRIVLPEKKYTEDEYALIFRHEIIHLGREDSTTKFFMTFCTSMCWFNPIMWFAMRKSADDLELSCDETVLLNSYEEEKEKYASLILKTAGDDRGFTTCLSSSAKSLRYRLKNIMKTEKRLTGGIFAGLLFFGLIMTSGFVALAYDQTTASEVLFLSQKIEEYQIKSINYFAENEITYVKCLDEKGLNQVISELKLSKLTGNYSFSHDENRMTIIYESLQGAVGVYIRDNLLTITPLYSDEPQQSYYIQDDIDWKLISSYCEEIVTQQDYLPFPMEMEIVFSDPSNSKQKESIPIEGIIVSVEERNEEIKQDSWDGKIIKTLEIEPSQIELIFSHDILTDVLIEVKVDNEDEVIFIDYTGEGRYLIELLPYDAHYTIVTNFREGESIFNMEFKFDVKVSE